MQLISVYIFYISATLLNSFISSNRFLMQPIGFSIIYIRSYNLQRPFTSFFPIFISFPCLIALDITSSTILNRKIKSSHPYFVPDLSRKTFNLSSLSIMFAMGFSHMAFIMLRYTFSIPNFLSTF